jgi:hypothetical protein
MDGELERSNAKYHNYPVTNFSRKIFIVKKQYV